MVHDPAARERKGALDEQFIRGQVGAYMQSTSHTPPVDNPNAINDRTARSKTTDADRLAKRAGYGPPVYDRANPPGYPPVPTKQEIADDEAIFGKNNRPNSANKQY